MEPNRLLAGDGPIALPALPGNENEERRKGVHRSRIRSVALLDGFWLRGPIAPGWMARRYKKKAAVPSSHRAAVLGLSAGAASVKYAREVVVGEVIIITV